MIAEKLAGEPSFLGSPDLVGTRSVGMVKWNQCFQIGTIRGYFF